MNAEKRIETMLKVQIDWLEFTVLNTQLPKVINTLDLGWMDFSPLAKGRFGYHNQLKWQGGSIFVMFTANSDVVDLDTKINPQSGIHVMITGQGCRQYSAKHDLMHLIRVLSAHERVNFTRIDLAVDDFESKIVSYDKIHDAAIKGHFTSRWSKWDEVTSRQTSTNAFLGRTMYFGSQASDLFCRVYDKTLERKVNSDQKDIPEKWTRLEMVYRKDRAKKLVDHMINGHKSPGYVLRGSLKQYLRFILPIADRNQARWPTAPWWSELLSNVEKLQLTIEKEDKTIEDMISWVDRQISPTLSAILEAHEGDLAWFRSILVEGSKRLSQKHKDAITQFLQKEGTPA